MFCQGDFLPGQVLCDPGGWSVIDFDDSRYADPLSEVAAMYAAMPRELGLSGSAPSTPAVPTSRRTPIAPARPLDRGRWQWFLALLQLTELGKRLMKGRVALGEAGAVMDRIEAGGHG